MNAERIADAELVAAIIARNRRDNGKTFTIGCLGQAIVDQMEWESLHERVLRAEVALKAARERESALRDALEDMVICAASMDWNNAEIHNARAALDAGDAEGPQQVPRKGN